MIADDLSRIAMSSSLGNALSRAVELARAQGHTEVTLEHMLVSLCEDPDAGLVLAASNVDIKRLKADAVSFLAGLARHSLPGQRVDPIVSADLRRILEAAAAAARGGRRREINGAIVLAAVVGDGKSAAAQMLQAQGLTFEGAIRALQRGAGIVPRSQPAASTEDILASARERVQSRIGPAMRRSESDEGLAPEETWDEPTPMEDAEEPIDDVNAPPEVESGAPEEFEPEPEPEPAPEPEPESEPEPEPKQEALEVMVAPEPEDEAQPAAQDFEEAGPAPAAAAEPEEPPAWNVPPPPPGPAPTPPPLPIPEASPIWTPPPVAAPAPPPLPPVRIGGAAPHAPRVGGDSPLTRPPPLERLPELEELRRPMGVGAAGEALRPPLGRAREPLASAPVGSQPVGRPMTAPRAEIGQLVENIPRTMRVAVAALVEVRIARADVQALAEGLQGGGAAYRHEVTVTKAMSVRLRAPDGGFFIETASPETQWIEKSTLLATDDYASWRWHVTPREKGRKRLQLIISARTVSADGLAAETALPDQVITVRVRTNYGRAVSRLVGWSVAALIGGLLARFGEGAFDTGLQIVTKLMKG